jgi:hypothetical protein
MAVRPDMGVLIDLVERLINDPDNTHHSEDEVQNALDQHREEAVYLELLPVKSVASGGTVTYVTFAAPADWTHWESGAELLDNNYDPLTPTAEDWLTGRWTFASEPTRPVRIRGWSYDIYGAAADLLEVRGSQLSEKYDSFAVFNGAFAASKRRGPLELAAKYRAMQRTRVVDVYRSDVNVWG